MTEEAPLLPLHPGEVLREDFMVPLGPSASALAKAWGVPRTRIERVASEEIGISGDTAIRLGRVFDTTPEFWMNLQQRFDLERPACVLGAAIDSIKPLERAA